MTVEEIIDLLTVAAAFDRRTVGQCDAAAWHAALGDLEFADSRQAVIAHYQQSREWVMPADVRTRVKAMRRDRLARAIIAAPPAGLAGQPGGYITALRAQIAQIADGFSVRDAIARPVRTSGPPRVWERARAALRHARPPGDDLPGLPPVAYPPGTDPFPRSQELD